MPGHRMNRLIFGEPGEPSPGVMAAQPCQRAVRQRARTSARILRDASASIGLGNDPRTSIETLDDKDWVRLTQSQFEPIRISARRLWIVPTWHTPSDANAINIVLDPGLAFGTGSHPTTRLCLRWLDGNLQGGERVLDYGCGSGILSIAAIKLGAAHAVGVDVDLQAVISSRDNAIANQAGNVQFYLPDDVAPSNDSLPHLVCREHTDQSAARACTVAGQCNAVRRADRVVRAYSRNRRQNVMNIYQQWFDLNIPIFEDGWSCLSGRKR